jgi:hypothetical protein
MIPTWLHGCIDYSVSTLFGVAATSASLSPAIRRTVGAAGACHVGYSLLTDYPAGLRPWLTMRQHLWLDAIGGAALCGAGLALRREPSGHRALLVAAGLAELAVVGCSSGWEVENVAPPEATSVTYAPLDTPKPIADGVFIVDSTLPGMLGKVLPVRMTVIRLPDGTLLLHSPTRLTEALRQALLCLGPVAHLVAPNIAHWTLLKPWQQAFPQASTWAAPGLRERRQVRRNGVHIDAELGSTAPAAWGDAIDLCTVPGGLGFHEVAMFHRPSGTLMLTDLVLNLEPPKVPVMARPLVRLFGSLAPHGMPPPYLRMIVRMRWAAAVSAAERLLHFRPERVIFAHGRWFDRDATQQLRRSLRWLLG